MKLTKLELAGVIASLALVFMAGVFAFSHFVYADDTPVDPCTDIFSQIPGMGCDDEGDNENQTPVDACEITPCGDDEPTLAEQITCEVFRQLVAAGEPIPQGFDSSGCEDDGGNSGGGGNNPAACDDDTDNDGDGRVDMQDPGCADAGDTDETDPATGGGGGNGGGGSGGGGGGGGGGGSVLGTTTPIACDKYLTEFIKFGGNNNEEQVKRLQHVLKEYEGASIEESGMYDQATLTAVHAFQTKYWDTILAPWNIKSSTGFVYLTTRKKVNEIYCKNEVAFPLSQDENTIIESSKSVHVVGAGAATAVSAAAKPAVTTETKTETTNTTTATEGATKRSGWGAIGNFFRRIFDRVR